MLTTLPRAILGAPLRLRHIRRTASTPTANSLRRDTEMTTDWHVAWTNHWKRRFNTAREWKFRREKKGRQPVLVHRNQRFGNRIRERLTRNVDIAETIWEWLANYPVRKIIDWSPKTELTEKYGDRVAVVPILNQSCRIVSSISKPFQRCQWLTDHIILFSCGLSYQENKIDMRKLIAKPTAKRGILNNIRFFLQNKSRISSRFGSNSSSCYVLSDSDYSSLVLSPSACG